MISEAEGHLTDLHSHLIPGVDDGAPRLDDALEGLDRMRDAGIAAAVTTPHLQGSLTRDPEELERVLAHEDEAWNELSAAVAERHPDLRLERGHEVRLDVPDPDLSDERLRMAGTSWVLVEWARFRIPPGSREAVEGLVDQGWGPILAHPERYGGLLRNPEVVEEWRSAGARLQVNHGSLVGRYGADARRRAFWLLERGWVDLLSTDFHGRPDQPLLVAEAREALEDVGGEEVFRVLAQENPGRILEDRELLPVPPLVVERGLWGRLLGVFGAEAP